MSGWVAWALLGLCLAAGFRPPLGLAASLLFWLALAFYPTDLKRPRGFGAWALWTSWSVIAAAFSREPLMSAQTCAERASGVVLFALAYSWWGRPHRRAWLTLLWTAAAAWGGYCLFFRRYDVAAAGLLAAAAGSCARGWAAETQEGYRRWLTGGLAVLFAGMLAAAVVREEAVSPAGRAAMWRAGLSQVSARPVTGVGPGLFEKGALRYALSPRRVLAARRAGAPGLARSEWVGAAAETGMIGLALFVIAIMFSLPRGSSREWERQAAGGAFLALAAFALCEEALKSPVLSMLWFSALACSAPGFEEQEARPFRLTPATAVLGAAATLLCAAPRVYARRLAKTDAELERAAVLAPADPALAAELARRSLAGEPPELGRALAWLDRAIEDSPRDPALLRRKADLFRLVGAEPEARSWEDRAAVLERDDR